MARSARIISAGLSLLEVLIALVIIAILITLLIPAYSATRARAQRAQCTANLRSLYLGANLYVTQNGSWPQITMVTGSDTTRQDFAQAVDYDVGALWSDADDLDLSNNSESAAKSRLRHERECPH